MVLLFFFLFDDCRIEEVSFLGRIHRKKSNQTKTLMASSQLPRILIKCLMLKLIPAWKALFILSKGDSQTRTLEFVLVALWKHECLVKFLEKWQIIHQNIVIGTGDYLTLRQPGSAVISSNINKINCSAFFKSFLPYTCDKLGKLKVNILINRKEVKESSCLEYEMLATWEWLLQKIIKDIVFNYHSFEQHGCRFLDAPK